MFIPRTLKNWGPPTNPPGGGGTTPPPATATVIGVSPETYGAVGDAVADDTLALQAALDYIDSQGGGQLILGTSKRYKTGPLKIGKRTSIVGGGRNSKLILKDGTYPAGTPFLGLKLKNEMGITLRSFEIDGSAVRDSVVHGIYMDDSTLPAGDPAHIIDSVYVKGFTGHGIILGYNARDSVITDSYVKETGGVGILLMGTDVTVSKTTTATTRSHGIKVEASNIRISGCKTFYAGYDWLSTLAFLPDVDGINITNVFEDGMLHVISVIGCEVQENSRHGIYLGTGNGYLGEITLIGNLSDSNNTYAYTHNIESTIDGSGYCLDARPLPGRPYGGISATLIGNVSRKFSALAGRNSYGIALYGDVTTTHLSGNLLDGQKGKLLNDSNYGTVSSLPNYNIADHGAKGDYATDNTAAIQALMDTVSAAGGGDIFVPKGDFVTSPLRIPGNITLTGAGRGSRLILRNATYPAGTAFISNKDLNSKSIRVSNLVLDGDYYSTVAVDALRFDYAGLTSSAPVNVVSDLMVMGWSGNGIVFGPDARECTVSGCLIKAVAGVGISITADATGAIVKDNYIDVTGSHGIKSESSNVRISGNTVIFSGFNAFNNAESPTADGIHVNGPPNVEVSNITLHNNSVKDCARHGYMLTAGAGYIKNVFVDSCLASNNNRLQVVNGSGFFVEGEGTADYPNAEVILENNIATTSPQRQVHGLYITGVVVGSEVRQNRFHSVFNNSGWGLAFQPKHLVKIVTANYTVSHLDTHIVVNASAAGSTITLPEPWKGMYQKLVIHCVGTNGTTISSPHAQINIEDLYSITLAPGSWAELDTDGTYWFVRKTGT